MQSFGCKAPGHEVFPSLRAMKEHHDRKLDKGASAAPSNAFLKRLVGIAKRNGADWTPTK